MKKLGEFFDNFERDALMIALSIMVIVIFTNVVMRYIFNAGLSWSEELSRYLFIWFSWMGVSAGVKDAEHLRVEILQTKLLKRGMLKTNEVLTIIVSLVWLATTVVVAYYGFIVVSSQMSLGVVTPGMRIPVWIGYLSVPACSTVVGIRLILNIITSIKKLLGKSSFEVEVAK